MNTHLNGFKRAMMVFIMAFMVFTIVFVPVIAQAAPADGDSSGSDDTMISSDGSANSRTSLFISMAKNSKDDNAKNIDFESMSKKDFQFLGVLMTNFYTPYMTELGKYDDYGDEDETKKLEKEAREKQKKSMTAALNITEEDADILLDFMIVASRNTAKPLKWSYGKTNFDKPDSLKASGGNTPPTMMQLQKMISGAFGVWSPAQSKTHDINVLNKDGEWGEKYDGNVCQEDDKNMSGDALKECWKDLAEKWEDNDKRKLTKDQELVYDKGYHYAFLTTPDGKPVFSANISAEYTTPSVASLAFASQIMDAENGVGTSFFEFTEESDKKLMKKLKKEDKIPKGNKGDKNGIYGMPLYVDAFGNIIVMGTVHQYILLPGAMNPFMFSPVDENGDEDKDYPAGTKLSPMNTIMMSLASQGKLCESSDGKCKVNMGEINKIRNSLDGKDNFASARILRGSSETELSRVGSAFEWTGEKSDTAVDFVKEAFTSYGRTNTAENGANQKAIIDSPVGTDAEEAFDSNLNNIANITITKIYLPYFGGSGVSMQNTELPINNKVLAIDDLGAFEGEKDDDIAGLFSTIDLLSTDGTLESKDEVKLDDDKFTNKLEESKYGNQLNSEAIFGKNMASFNTLFYTYAVAALDTSGDGGEDLKKIQGKLGYRLNPENFPDVCEGGEDVVDCKFELSDEQKDKRDKANADQMNEDIRNWVWYILNPAEGFNYVSLLIKNKVTSSAMNLHSDMLGTTGAPAVAGSTKYVGFSGYVTIPNLTDLPWTAKIVDFYNGNYFYIIAIVVIIMGVYAVTGVLSLQQAIGGAVLFAILAAIPLHLLTASIDFSNRVTEIAYGKKFTYWALIQNQTYSDAIDKAATGDDYDNYLKTELAKNQEIDITNTGHGSSNKGQDSVVVKWQAPKKMASLMFSGKMDKSEKALLDNPLFSNVLASDDYARSGQSYAEADDSVYMFRSYIDLNNFSRYIYRGIDEGNVDTNTNIDSSKWPEGLKNSWEKRDEEFKYAVKSGYNNPNKDGGHDIETSSRVMTPLSSDMVPDTFNQADRISKGLTQKDNIGLDTRSFNFSLPAFTNGDTDLLDGIKETTKGFDQGDFDPTQDGKYDEKDYAGLAGYGLMSESPFYYYSWNLYDQGLSADANAKDGYKKLLLSGKNNPYFYNTEGNRELKDYDDMKSLFTYVIPYLRAGNDVVRRFDSTYGLTYEPGVPTEEGHWDDEGIKSDPVMKQKYWKNLQASRLYSIYSPWVDLMYDANYAEPQTIMVQGEKVNIKDPIDPSSYPEERPMVFSKSEQRDYGIDDGQLTTVEKKIQNVQKNTQEQYFQLLNAYNFNDNVLNTAAAMENTFEFNKEFSETHWVGENIQLYPQSYELKNFSYDAYLRLILANATGESVSGQSADDFYIKVVENSSMMTSAVIIVLDFLSVYVVPAFKIFLVISIGIMMVMMILMSAIRIVEGVWKNILDAIVKPLVSMMAVFIGMGWLISIFMSNGNTSVTGYDGTSVSLGDPVMTMLVMIVINAFVIFLLWKISKNVWSHLVRFTKMIFGSMTGVAAGAGTMAAGVIKGQGFRKSRDAGVSRTASAVGAGAAAGAVAGTAASRAEDRANSNKGNVGPLKTRSAPDATKRSRKDIGFNKRGDVKSNSKEEDKKRNNIDMKAAGRKASDGVKKTGEGIKKGAKGTSNAVNNTADAAAARSTFGTSRRASQRQASEESYREARLDGASRREARKEQKEDFKRRKEEYNRNVDAGMNKTKAYQESVDNKRFLSQPKDNFIDRRSYNRQMKQRRKMDKYDDEGDE